MSTTIELFTPFPAQKNIIDNFVETDELFGVVVAPRGSGKTLLAINVMLYWLLLSNNAKGGWISPIYNQAKSVYDTIVKSADKVILKQNRQDLQITFINGSTLKFLSTDKADTIRGFRFTHLIIDEVAFQKELNITQVVLPTLNPTGKKCLMISTPKGKNHFYKWYNKGVSKEDNSIVSFKIKLTECPYNNKELIEAARKSLPPELFKQEYLAEFTDSSNDVFVGIDKVSIVTSYEPSHEQEAYIGIDTGLTSDMSALTILSPTGRVLLIEYLNNENISTIANKFIATMSKYKILGGYIETNGIGRAMYDLISPHFRKVKEFNTSQDSKTDMVRKLISDIESLTVELPTMELCPLLHSEFTTFIYKMSPNGKLSFGHMSGASDDLLDSLLMANFSRNQFMNRNHKVRVNNVRQVKPSFGLPS